MFCMPSGQTIDHESSRRRSFVPRGGGGSMGLSCPGNTSPGCLAIDHAFLSGTTRRVCCHHVQTGLPACHPLASRFCRFVEAWPDRTKPACLGPRLGRSGCRVARHPGQRPLRVPAGHRGHPGRDAVHLLARRVSWSGAKRVPSVHGEQRMRLIFRPPRILSPCIIVGTSEGCYPLNAHEESALHTRQRNFLLFYRDHGLLSEA